MAPVKNGRLMSKHEAFKRVQRLVPQTAGHTWVFGYHLVGGGTGLPIDTPRDDFIAQLDLLQEEAEIIPLRELVRDLRRGGGAGGMRTTGDGSEVWPAGPAESGGPGWEVGAGRRPRVVLTFDDAFQNFYEVVLPILAARGLPATLYVPPGFINGDGNNPLYIERFAHMGPMTWEQLAHAVLAGIEIGSHTYRHTNLVRLPITEVAAEMGKAQDEIERVLDVRPTSVCYPEGFFNDQVVRAASRFYESGMTGGGMAIRPGRRVDLLRLPRLPVLARDTVEDLAAKLHQGVCLEEWASSRIRVLRGLRTARA